MNRIMNSNPKPIDFSVGCRHELTKRYGDHFYCSRCGKKFNYIKKTTGISMVATGFIGGILAGLILSKGMIKR